MDLNSACKISSESSDSLNVNQGSRISFKLSNICISLSHFYSWPTVWCKQWRGVNIVYSYSLWRVYIGPAYLIVHVSINLVFLQSDSAHLSVAIKGAGHLVDLLSCSHMDDVVGGDESHSCPNPLLVEQTLWSRGILRLRGQFWITEMPQFKHGHIMS